MITAIEKNSKNGNRYLALVVRYPSGKTYDLRLHPSIVRSLVRSGIVDISKED